MSPLAQSLGEDDSNRVAVAEPMRSPGSEEPFRRTLFNAETRLPPASGIVAFDGGDGIEAEPSFVRRDTSWAVGSTLDAHA